MTSSEPKRSSAYSEDLRWRVVWQTEGLRISREQVAKNLCIDKSTVSRIHQKFLICGSVEKRPYPKDRANRKLSVPAQLLVLPSVIDKPGILLREIQDDLLNVLMIEVDVATICRFLHDSGFSRQKLCHVALQRDQILRDKFIMDVSLYDPNMLIFLDETGADRRNALRQYGYSMRGKPLKKYSLLVRGEHVSAIGIMSVKGLLDVSLDKGTTDGDKFYHFVLKHLLPQLQQCNGNNSHSVVILDNCSIHHVGKAASAIQDAGAIVHYLPPYSPDFNPIEEAFSKVKTLIMNMESSTTTDDIDIETIVLSAFASITSEDCKGWILNCSNGIYN